MGSRAILFALFSARAGCKILEMLFPRRSIYRALFIAWVLVSVSVRAADPGSPALSNRLSVAIEALNRLKGIDLESNPALKAAVLKVIESTKGTSEFVELVRDFKIKGQGAALLDYAEGHPQEASGVEAMRLVLADGDLDRVKQALAGPEISGLVQVLGNTSEKEVVPLLEPITRDSARPIELRKQAVRALVQTREGAEAVLKIAQQSNFPDELKKHAVSELLEVHWPDLQAEAARMVPSADLPPGLPPISELVKRTGDARRGAEIFSRETVGCAKCHRVRGQGGEVGPDLSEIGTKLAKEAIYAAILDPSAGIAFGYEAWDLELNNGDEAYGLLANETRDEIAIKAPTGIVTRYKKSEVAKRVQLKTSIMPSGLTATMSPQDLVDLVEYLASLKKQK